MKRLTKDDSFSSTRLFFKGIQIQDTDSIVQWRSDPALIKYSINTISLTREKHLEWFQQYLYNNDRYDFIIIEKQSGQAIGIIGLRNFDDVNQSAEVSILIGHHPRKGFATESLNALLNHIKPLDYKKIWAQIHVDNTASIHLFEKVSFSLNKKMDAWLYYEYVF